MGIYENSSRKMIISIMMIVTALLGQVTTFPVDFPDQTLNSNTGQKVTVSSRSQLSAAMNHTVPSILTASINPYEYLRLRGHNVTGLNILPYLMSKSLGQKGNTSRINIYGVKSTESCPVKWVVNMEADRDPVRIYEAVCNGVGTTCLSEAKPSCQEFSITYNVNKFLGMDKDGNEIWQEQYLRIPVAGQCAVVRDMEK